MRNNLIFFLQLLSTTIIKNGGYKVLYNWQIPGYDYWPVWGRQAGCFIQLAPLVLVPIAGVIQTIRYLTTGPPDIFEVSAFILKSKYLSDLLDLGAKITSILRLNSDGVCAKRYSLLT